MDCELWKSITAQIRAVDRNYRRRKAARKFTHSVGKIVWVYLWSVFNDRPVYWACKAENYRGVRQPRSLPDQSCMSRRLRSHHTHKFIRAVIQRLTDKKRGRLIKAIDGKPLPISKITSDPDASYGRGAGGIDKGYKLHAICSVFNEPIAWEVQPINISEKAVAKTLINQLYDEGYLLADSNYDTKKLHRAAANHGHQLVASRRKPGTSLWHNRQPRSRLRSIELLEGGGEFGRNLFKIRKRIEGYFGNLSADRIDLPPWVRRLHRVRLFVDAKLLIRAARQKQIRSPAA
ncbi:MAG: transposase [FCB group bacterium]|nr:transposase [FCB group bacterium]